MVKLDGFEVARINNGESQSIQIDEHPHQMEIVMLSAFGKPTLGIDPGTALIMSGGANCNVTLSLRPGLVKNHINVECSYDIFDCTSGYIKASQVEQAEAEQPEPKQEAATPSADSVLTKIKAVFYAPADIQAREIADVRAHPYSRYIAEEIAKDWGPGGQMYELLSDPSLMVNRMMLVVSNSNVRFNVECDDSITKLYETLPQSVWEKDYDLASFTQLPDLNCVGFTVPLTDAQRFGIHERIRDELAKLPYYSVSLGKDTLTARDLQTKEIHYMSTLFHIVF